MLANWSMPLVDLTGSDLTGAILRVCKLNGAKLNDSNLTETVFIDCDLEETDFTGANLASAIFVNVDLRSCKGLDDTKVDSARGRTTRYRYGYTQNVLRL
jgi:uncharacterized protein YjbI with pentapeptide repeats